MPNDRRLTDEFVVVWHGAIESPWGKGSLLPEEFLDCQSRERSYLAERPTPSYRPNCRHPGPFGHPMGKNGRRVTHQVYASVRFRHLRRA